MVQAHGFAISTLLACLGMASLLISSVAVSARPGQQPGPSQDSRPRRVNQAQDDKPIRLSANLVTVIAAVSDPAGNPVNDLTPDDFDVFEDTIKQDISGLYREGQMPLRMVFLFDTSSSIRSRFDFEKRAASLFFQQVLRTGDEAAIMSVSTDPKLEIEFTPDADRLVSAINTLRAGGATSLYNAMIEAAKYLRQTKGRHVILVLSDGTDTSSSATLARSLAEVQKSDAVIYGVHSMGVAASANVQDLAGEFVLKTMSEDTGGRAFFPPIYQEQKKEARDLEDIYSRISAEVRAQYVLTYYSNSQSRDGRFQAIAVRVKRPGLQVRSRRGYYTSTSQ